jgi:apolipoprotein D and lipocalin family protein
MNPAALRRYSAVVLATMPLLITGCSQTPPNPNPRAAVPLQAASIDLPRYLGRWYVIAIIPYALENRYVGSYAQWTLRPDGQIDDRYTAHPKRFDAAPSTFHFVDSVVPGSANGEWKVRIFWPIYVTQLTLYVDDDYRYTLLGLRDKSLGWVFAREPDIGDADYRSLLARFDALGFDVSRFRRVPQRPEQIGEPGFLSPAD